MNHRFADGITGCTACAGAAGIREQLFAFFDGGKVTPFTSTTVPHDLRRLTARLSTSFSE
ncbi:hypothetical protein BN2475_340098 [Paraburkholderia ribeironis]|uniref:Uncharacterized protein n=1 Tax=Paraburkholderia ribeironis TaxID=1247936 RepID=A0A1N7S483_9BURK|nr:hypothetical protein BN2475_340098 [Paraburkholderia ribeironis]